jgi:hypothetical protein
MHDTTLHEMEPSDEKALNIAPSSFRSAMLQPISPHHLPEAEPVEPLFLPAKARRRWYLGYLHHWKHYQRNVTDHWESDGCKRVFDELKECELDESRSAATTEGENHTTSEYNTAGKHNTAGEDNTVGEDNTGPAKLEEKFRSEVAEIVEIVYNKMLTTWTMKQLDAYKQPERIFLRKAGSYSKVKPRFWFRAKPVGQALESKSRVIGHVEYLGGRPGALTWAVEEAAKNSWGSLRSVLGKSIVLPRQTFGDCCHRRYSLAYAQDQHKLWLCREQ